MRLKKLKKALEEALGQKAQLEGQLTQAETKLADLREKLVQKDAIIKKTQNKCKQLEIDLKQVYESERIQGEHSLSLEANKHTADCCKNLLDQLHHAKQHQREAQLGQQAAELERDGLKEQLQQATIKFQEAQQELTGTAAMAVLNNTGSNENGCHEPSSSGNKHELDNNELPKEQLEHRLMTISHQLELVEFERNELRLKLEQSYKQVRNKNHLIADHHESTSTVTFINSTIKHHSILSIKSMKVLAVSLCRWMP